MATTTSRFDELREMFERLNSRQFHADEDAYLPDVRFHASAMGVDVEGRDELAAVLEKQVTAMDAHFELRDVVELGPFVIQYVGVIATIDGKRMASDMLNAARFEGDKIAEVWSMVGGDPEPAG